MNSIVKKKAYRPMRLPNGRRIGPIRLSMPVENTDTVNSHRVLVNLHRVPLSFGLWHTPILVHYDLNLLDTVQSVFMCFRRPLG